MSRTNSVIVRKAVGLTLFAVGGFMVAFAATRYVSGELRADAARSAWSEVNARAALAVVRTVALRNGRNAPLVDGTPVARLVIPRIDLDEIVLEGVEAEDLNAAPGHLPGSALPGERGNAVIAAHRDRHFNHLDALEVGDTITTESGSSQNNWIVVSTRIVDKDARALFHTADATLTLTTCWPIRYVGPAPERLIVTAKLIPRAAARVALN